jgi:hypothetical protein
MGFFQKLKQFFGRLRWVDADTVEARACELTMKEMRFRKAIFCFKYENVNCYEEDYRQILEAVREVLRTKKFGSDCPFLELGCEDFPEVRLKVGDFVPRKSVNEETDLDLGGGPVRCTKRYVRWVNKHPIEF